jgi:hypothetical protein
MQHIRAGAGQRATSIPKCNLAKLNRLLDFYVPSVQQSKIQSFTAFSRAL